MVVGMKITLVGRAPYVIAMRACRRQRLHHAVGVSLSWRNAPWMTLALLACAPLARLAFCPSLGGTEELSGVLATCPGTRGFRTSAIRFHNGPRLRFHESDRDGADTPIAVIDVGPQRQHMHPVR
jgi:hypothetical protein